MDLENWTWNETKLVHAGSSDALRHWGGCQSLNTHSLVLRSSHQILLWPGCSTNNLHFDPIWGVRLKVCQSTYAWSLEVFFRLLVHLPIGLGVPCMCWYRKENWVKGSIRLDKCYDVRACALILWWFHATAVWVSGSSWCCPKLISSLVT